MNKLILAAALALATITTANAAERGFLDSQTAASPLLDAASKAMLEDGVFNYCKNYAEWTICEMNTGNMVVLKDKPFAADACKSPDKRNKVKLGQKIVYTCVQN